MYATNQIKGAGTLSAQQRQHAIPEAPCGLPSAELRQSEIERELNTLHFALDSLAQSYDSLQDRLAPVSASFPDTATCASEAPEPVPSCVVASGVFSARQRIQHLTNRVHTSIELLRC